MNAQAHGLIAGFLALIGLDDATPNYQGYGEGEYVLVSQQIAGTIDEVKVVRGQTVHTGDLLYVLEHVSEQADLDKAKAQLDHDEANLADLLKAKRQPELDQLLAARNEAKAAVQITDINVVRDEKLLASHAISQAVMDTDHAALDQARAKMAQAEAALATGLMSTGRDDAIRAAQATSAASQAGVVSAQWKLDQKTVFASTDAYVFDTIHRKGEYVKAGDAVISLLPASNIRVRFFVPGTALPDMHTGMAVTIHETGSDKPRAAHVSYLSPQAEYSPPELYNRDNREKLLYMIEATPDSNPEGIHPGQPVDVSVSSP
jgi:HlyD family secretion protein